MKTVSVLLVCVTITFVLSENQNSTERDEGNDFSEFIKMLNFDENFMESLNDYFEKREYFVEMLESMDLFTEPCNDFYQHACGDFNEMHPMEPGKMGHGTIHKMTESINEDLHKVLSDNATKGTPDAMLSRPDKIDENLSDPHDVALKARVFYNSCLNADVFKFSKSEVYAELIQSLGGMPVLESNWTAKDFDFTKVIATLRLYGAIAFIDEYTSERYVYVKRGVDFGLLPISLRDLNKISSKMYSINKNLMQHLMETYGAEENDAIDAVDDILNFGKKFLGKVELIRPAKPKYKRISYLEKHHPQVEWIKYFSILFGRPVDGNFKVIISDLNYFDEFSRIFEERDKRTLANYLMLKLLFELHAEYKSARYPKVFCLRQSQKWLEPVPNLMYIESSYYDDSPEDKVATLVGDIKSTFKETIGEADWLDQGTKEAAIAKLEKIKILIGSKNISVDLRSFEDFYKDLIIVPNNYPQNNLNVRRFKTVNTHNLLAEHQSIRARVDIEVNAEYQITSNQLILPAGILQKPMYHPDMPFAYNFASMGANIIGHEMVHGFDSIGRHYDSDGRESNWWSDKSSAEFDERAQCFIDQYDGYVIEGLHVHVNGSKTLAENIADNGGLRLGFFAYKKWLEKNKEDEEISFGIFSYTNLQFYFLSFAHASCSEFKRKGLLRIAEDVHTADKFRVNGPVSNFDEFAKAFNCSKNSPMNPARKCVLW